MSAQRLPDTRLFVPRDTFAVLEYMRTAEDWHDGLRTAMYQFGRHGKPFAQRRGLELLQHYLKFYRRLLRETRTCLKQQAPSAVEATRLKRLETFIEQRLAEYRLLEDLESAQQRAEALDLPSVAMSLKESARVLSVELQFPL